MLITTPVIQGRASRFKFSTKAVLEIYLLLRLVESSLEKQAQELINMEAFIHNDDENSPSVTQEMLMLSKKARITDSRFPRIGLDMGQITWHPACFMHDAFVTKSTPPSKVSLVDDECLTGHVNDSTTGYKEGGRMASVRIGNMLEQPIINKADNPPPQPKGNGPKGPPQPRDGAGNRFADQNKMLGNLGVSIISLFVGFSGAVKASQGTKPKSYI